MTDAGGVLGGVLIVDKDNGWTSHDVVARCRKLFGTKKIGHAGTLDPMATGVLVLGVGRATKLLGMLTLTSKSYTATIRLGQATNTDDAEGEILTQASASDITDDQIAAAVDSLTGDIQQVPATVSAIKVGGQRAYARHRAGEDVRLAAREVTVSRFAVCARRNVAASELESQEHPDLIDLDVEVDCSSGTYVRALARDLGVALGVGGHLTELRRTRVGPFTLDQARTLDQLATDPTLTLDIDTAIRTAFPHRTLDAQQVERLRDGGRLSPTGQSGAYAALAEDGRAIALLAEKNTHAAPVFVVRPRGLAD